MDSKMDATRRTLSGLSLMGCFVMVGCGASSNELPDGGSPDGGAPDASPFTIETGGEWPPMFPDAGMYWSDPDPRPPWTPPFTVADTADWNGSTVDFCDVRFGTPTVSKLWAGNGKVLALASTYNNVLAGDLGPSGEAVFSNDGGGWDLTYTLEDDLSGMTSSTLLVGLTDGRVMFGPNATCDVIEVSGAGSLCSLRVTGAGVLRGLVAEGNEVAAVYEAAVFRYNGSDWALQATYDYDLGAVVGGTIDNLVVARGAADVFAVQGDVVAPMGTPPAGPYAAVALDPSGSDVWLATSAGSLYRNSGGTWTFEAGGASPCAPAQDPVVAFWRGPGRLYFIRATSFGYVESGTVHPIFDYACDSNIRLRSVGGLDDDEVFFSVVDPSFAVYECGAFFLLWYDGTDLHML